MNAYCPAPACPTLEAFNTFLRAQGFTTAVLPDNSPVIQEAFCAALETVNPFIRGAAPTQYNLAVYNYGTDYVLNYSPDIPNPPLYQDKLPFFAYWRKQLNIMGFVSGVITSAGDQGTSSGLAVGEGMQNLTLGDVQLTKTFWGRNYLAIAQKWGPDLFGLT